MMLASNETAKTLAGRVCVVTGASKGLGRTLAGVLARAGAQVALLARPSAELEAAAAEIGPAAFAAPCDVSAPDTVDRAFSDVVARFGRLDSVICNAAICSLLKIETAAPEQIAREVAVNLLGPVYCTRAAIPHLRAAGGGDLVYVTSESVRMPYPYLTLYAAAKGGVEVFAAGMRNELREQNTRVAAVRCGAIEGTRIEDAWDPAQRDDFFRAAAAMGASAFTGLPASQETVAQAVLSILALPRDANVDLLEVRGR